jgi:hypothetical protein
MIPFRSAAVLVSLVAAAAALAAAQDNGQKATARRFKEAPCPFKADENIRAQVRCGCLIDSENRAHPERRLAPLIRGSRRSS